MVARDVWDVEVAGSSPVTQTRIDFTAFSQRCKRLFPDTGKGFSDETLELIKQQKPIIYDGCEHIGIYNTLQRIQMAYGEKAEVKFGNMKKNYGAVVEIMLPMERGGKENYEIQNI